MNNYVEAFTEALAEVSGTAEKDKVISNFSKLLRRTGDIKSGAKIAAAIHKKMVNNENGKWVNIESARQLSDSKSRSLKSKFSKKDNITFNINPELVAGVRILVNGEEELDNTLNQKLNRLFR